MLISVIIIAYDRKQFLLEAIQSALNQSLSREKYEIIVIKNYKDDYIDEFMIKNGIKNIVSEDISLSGKILEALEVAKNEIVSFLEDDDRFFNNKLEVVLKNFENIPNLVYYHNSNIFEDDERNELQFKFNNPSFNLSSISIRKEIIYKEALKSLTSGLDTFFYFNSIDSGGILKDDNEALTYYRYHGELQTYAIDFNTYLDHRLHNLRDNINGYKSIMSYLKTDSGIKNISNQLITTKILANILNSLTKEDLEYSVTIRDLISWLIYPEYYNRRFPFIFKLIKYFEVVMPNSLKAIIEKIDYEKRKNRLFNRSE